jgi:hypothetical protein
MLLTLFTSAWYLSDRMEMVYRDPLLWKFEIIFSGTYFLLTALLPVRGLRVCPRA